MEVQMAATHSARKLERALRLLRLHDAQQELDVAVSEGTPSGDLLFAVRDIAPLSTDALRPLASDPLEGSGQSQYELALAWIPVGVPVSTHLYLNGTALPAGTGTFTSGRLFVPLPANLIKTGDNKLLVALRFWQGRWKYQLWARNQQRRGQIDSGADADPSATDDDIVVKESTVNFEAL